MTVTAPALTLADLAMAHGRYFTSLAAAWAAPSSHDWAPQGGVSGLCVVEPGGGSGVVAISSNAQVNTPQKPGCLLVLGGSSLQLGGNRNYHGTVYCEGSTEVIGTAGVHGTLLSQGNVVIRSTHGIACNDACVA